MVFHKINDLVDGLKNGWAIRILINGKFVLAEMIGLDDLRALISRPDLTVAIGLGQRPGVAAAQRWLELTWFRPDTPANELISPLLWKWRGTVWIITLVPADPDHTTGRPSGDELVRQAADWADLVAERGIVSVMHDSGPLDDASQPDFETGLGELSMVRPELDLGRAWFLVDQPGLLIYRDPVQHAHNLHYRIEQLEIAVLGRSCADSGS